MTEVDPQDYFDVAKKLADASVAVDTAIRGLDTNLNVSQSAGKYSQGYHSGGPKWASTYDQSASDVYELASLSAVAARELGYQVHQMGLNHLHAENGSHPGPDDPDPPQGTKMERSIPPSKRSVGGTEGNPWGWSLVDDFVKKQWADCDQGRITGAGTNFQTFGTARTQDATNLWNGVVGIFNADAQAANPEVDGIVDDLQNVCKAMNGSGEIAGYLATACSQVATMADGAKSDCKTSLILLAGIVASYEADKVAARRIPFAGNYLRRKLDQLIDYNKRKYAELIDARLGNIDDKVRDAAKSNEGIYDLATSEARLLSSILDRTPRNTDEVKFRDETQNKAAGDEGERRAGIDPKAPKREVTIIDPSTGKARDIVPDRIDEVNQQVTEVKNTNEIKPDKQQILDEAQYAREQGYTMTLIVDHRTKINDPEIQAKIDSGEIQLVRKELDDNDDH